MLDTKIIHPTPVPPPDWVSILFLFQSDVVARKALLRLSESAWADSLIEMALCERELDDPFSTAVASSPEDAMASSRKVRGVPW